MDFSFLVEFSYDTAFIAEYSYVLLLQVLLYLSATTSVGLFYRAFSIAGIGTKIEQRANYKNQILSEIGWSLCTCLIIASYFYFAFAFVDDVYPHHWMSAVMQVLGFILAYDFYMYITHRVLHSKPLRKFHRRHHTAVSATPWSCLNMHPVEAFVNYLPFPLFAILTPTSLTVLIGIHVYLIFGIAIGHSNYSLIPLQRTPFLIRELITFHQKHHSDGSGNYGLLFTHWDWVFGTRHK